MMNDSELIQGCKGYEDAAQKALYYKYAPVMKAICIRYCTDKEEAKDILQESFIKIYSKINSYSGKGSFEGWMKRIVVNTALYYYKKNKKQQHQSIDDFPYSSEGSQVENELDFSENDEVMDSDFTEQELLNALNLVPESFRIVFNLFYIEEISHKEISELLSIDEKTSRTRLFRAKKVLHKHLTELKSKKAALK